MVVVVVVNKSAYLARNAARDAHSKTKHLITQGTSTAKHAVPASPYLNQAADCIVGVQQLCLDVLWRLQKKLESAHREAQVLEIKRQGQMKALEAQRAKKEVCYSFTALLTSYHAYHPSDCSLPPHWACIQLLHAHLCTDYCWCSPYRHPASVCLRPQCIQAQLVHCA